MESQSAATATDAVAPVKRHFVILDGLRGVASLMVLVFHLFEAFAEGDPHKQIVNHGYLAVDFFFLLSGFVIAYAYDDRWGRMGVGGFALRRLVRLQPMVVMGTLVGLALFPWQDYTVFPRFGSVTGGHLALIVVLGCLMIPVRPSMDVRGWSEIYPLNGPAWSLFYEYLANAAYALGLRRLSNRWLGLLAAIAAAALLHLALLGPRGDLIGGWALDPVGVKTGLTRVAFPFLAGILLMRLGGTIRIGNAFAVSSLLLVTLLALPRMGGREHLWVNGLYEAGCVILLFPLIVAIGAGETRADGPSVRVARFFGDLSYPLYITHYPLIYIYTGWVVDAKVTPLTGAIVGAGVFVAAVALAWACLRFYDLPVRRWLAARVLRRA
jgi:peptidoglycan/LPS O-acetylase OafA/YrhL